MNRLPKLHATLMGMFLLAGCASPAVQYADNDYAGNYDNDGAYANYTDNSASCDYYTPPWGYPADYCRYELWNEPVYYRGVWYSGPIYSRNYGGETWFWLNGDWRRDEWRGPRPRIDWNRGGNVFWQGDVHRGRDRFEKPDRNPVRRTEDFRGDRDRDSDGDRRNNPMPSGGNGRFGDRGVGNGGREVNNPPPVVVNPPPPNPNAGVNGRFGDRGVGNGGRDVNNPPPVVVNPPPPNPNGGGNGRFGDRGVGNGGRDVTNTPPVVANPPPVVANPPPPVLANPRPAEVVNPPPVLANPRPAEPNGGGNGRFGDRGVGNGGREVNNSPPSANNPPPVSPSERLSGRFGDRGVGNGGSPENVRKVADTDKKPAGKPDADKGNRKGNGRRGDKDDGK